MCVASLAHAGEVLRSKEVIARPRFTRILRNYSVDGLAGCIVAERADPNPLRSHVTIIIEPLAIDALMTWH